MSSWTEGLRPASWRGVPFSVVGAESVLGRRVAVHEYPFRDEVWVEDLGSGRNTFVVTGFIVGDDVISLRDSMQAAAQTPGEGELVHPTFGCLQVACIDFRTAERWDAGRVIELAFTFVKAGPRLYPKSAAATGDQVNGAADAADKASSGSFLSQIKGAVNQVVGTAQKYAGMAQRLVGDARRVLGSVSGLIPGGNKIFGRFNAVLGRVSSKIGTASTYINRAASTRSAVERAATNVKNMASRL